MEKQTAVEWLIGELEQSILMTSSVKTTIKQAKEKEKQQIIEHSVELAKIIISNPIETSGKMAWELVDDYFKTTFKDKL